MEYLKKEWGNSPKLYVFFCGFVVFFSGLAAFR